MCIQDATAADAGKATAECTATVVSVTAVVSRARRRHVFGREVVHVCSATGGSRIFGDLSTAAISEYHII